MVQQARRVRRAQRDGEIDRTLYGETVSRRQGEELSENELIQTAQRRGSPTSVRTDAQRLAVESTHAEDVQHHSIIRTSTGTLTKREGIVQSGNYGEVDDERLLEIQNNSIVDERGCWVWQGSKGKRGHGQISIEGTSLKVHRLVFHNCKGHVPESDRGLGSTWVTHKCSVVCADGQPDNPSCINPAHLELGTARENSLDAVRVGSMYNPSGDLNQNARYTEAQWRDLQARVSSGEFDGKPMEYVAEQTEFNVSALRQHKRRKLRPTIQIEWGRVDGRIPEAIVELALSETYKEMSAVNVATELYKTLGRRVAASSVTNWRKGNHRTTKAIERVGPQHVYDRRRKEFLKQYSAGTFDHEPQSSIAETMGFPGRQTLISRWTNEYVESGHQKRPNAREKLRCHGPGAARTNRRLRRSNRRFTDRC